MPTFCESEYVDNAIYTNRGKKCACVYVGIYKHIILYNIYMRHMNIWEPYKYFTWWISKVSDKQEDISR